MIRGDSMHGKLVRLKRRREKRQGQLEPSCSDKVALVLSGGGVRGAYEVGVVAGVVEALDLKPQDDCPFRIFTGTSVGAINAAFLAANADHGDLGISRLADIWKGLEVKEHVRLNRLRLCRRQRKNGGALFDHSALEAVVSDSIDWRRLKRNVDDNTVHALVVAAFEIAAAQTTMFAQLSPETVFRVSRNPDRRVCRADIGARHVLASAAIPFVFPARKIDDGHYCDGGLRHNTPLSPAIRCGAEKLLIVSVVNGLEGGAGRAPNRTSLPGPAFMVGKILNALMADPLSYDLERMERCNKMIAQLEQSLNGDEMERIDELLTQARGVSYRPLQKMVFMPSEDIGALAADYLRRALPRRGFSTLTRWLVRRALASDTCLPGDLASVFLFDGGFAELLITMGKRDALRRRDEVRAFFGRGLASLSRVGANTEIDGVGYGVA
jgi:NTE family protein